MRRLAKMWRHFIRGQVETRETLFSWAACALRHVRTSISRICPAVAVTSLVGYELATHKGPEKLMKKVAFIAIGVLIIVVVAMTYYANVGRFDRLSANREATLEDVQRYVSKGQNRSFVCTIDLDSGFPKRYPNAVGELYTSNQLVWSYRWSCVGQDEHVTGIVAIFADGNSVFSGTSDVRGDLATVEY